MGGAGLFAAGQGMAAQEAAAPRQALVQGRHDRRLVLPASVISVPSGQDSGRLADEAGDLGHGRANDHQLRLGDPFGQIDGRMGDGPDPPGHPQARLAAADADDRVGQIPAGAGPCRSIRRSGRRPRSPRFSGVSSLVPAGAAPHKLRIVSAVECRGQGPENGGRRSGSGAAGFPCMGSRVFQLLRPPGDLGVEVCATGTASPHLQGSARLLILMYSRCGGPETPRVGRSQRAPQSLVRGFWWGSLQPDPPYSCQGEAGTMLS